MFEKNKKQHSNDTHINETEYSKQYAVRCNWFTATTFPQATVSPITMKLAVNARLHPTVYKLFFLDI